MAGQVECPNGGTCSPSCKGFQEACGLRDWKNAHPIPAVPEDLTSGQRRLARARQRKAQGTWTFMTNTIRGIIGGRCENRRQKKSR